MGLDERASAAHGGSKRLDYITTSVVKGADSITQGTENRQYAPRRDGSWLDTWESISHLAYVEVNPLVPHPASPFLILAVFSWPVSEIFRTSPLQYLGDAVPRET